MSGLKLANVGPNFLLQYTAYIKGGGKNYSGTGRIASSNNFFRLASGRVIEGELRLTELRVGANRYPTLPEEDIR